MKETIMNEVAELLAVINAPEGYCYMTISEAEVELEHIEADYPELFRNN